MHFLTFIFSILSLTCLTFINHVSAKEFKSIIGGDLGKISDFKFFCFTTVLKRRICGCSILNNNYVLTAAHCITDKKGIFIDYSYGVVAGVNKVKDQDTGIKTSVTKVYIHKDYESKTLANDIAILMVKDSFDVERNSDRLQTVKLPESEDVYTNNIDKEGFVPGFGWDSIEVRRSWLFCKDTITGKSSGILKYSKVELISQEECERNTADDPITFIDKVVCAFAKPKTLQDTAGICYGDSGGPLVLANTNEILGLVSYSSENCDDTTRAAVFTKVFSYKNLIDDIMNGRENNDAKPIEVKSIIRYTLNIIIRAFCGCLRSPASNDADAALAYAVNRCPCPD